MNLEELIFIKFTVHLILHLCVKIQSKMVQLVFFLNTCFFMSCSELLREPFIPLSFICSYLAEALFSSDKTLPFSRWRLFQLLVSSDGLAVFVLRAAIKPPAC